MLAFAQSGDRVSAAADTERPMLDVLATVLEPLAPLVPAEERRSMAGLLIHTVVSLLNYAVTSAKDEDTFNSTVAEIKRMIVAYLFAVATG